MPRTSPAVDVGKAKGISIDVLTGRETQRIVQIKGYGELLTVVVVGYTETAANYRLTVTSEELAKKTALEAGRPGNGYTRLEIVLVPVVKGPLAIRLSGQLD